MSNVRRFATLPVFNTVHYVYRLKLKQSEMPVQRKYTA